MKFSSAEIALITALAGKAIAAPLESRDENGSAGVRTLKHDVKGPDASRLKPAPSDLPKEQVEFLKKYQPNSEAASDFIGPKQSVDFSDEGLCFKEYPCFSVQRSAVRDLGDGAFPQISAPQMGKFLEDMLSEPSITFDQEANPEVPFVGYKLVKEGYTFQMIAPEGKADSKVIAGMAFDMFKLQAADPESNSIRAVQARTDDKTPAPVALCIFPEKADEVEAYKFCIGDDIKVDKNIDQAKKETRDPGLGPSGPAILAPDWEAILKYYKDNENGPTGGNEKVAARDPIMLSPEEREDFDNRKPGGGRLPRPKPGGGPLPRPEKPSPDAIPHIPDMPEIPVPGGAWPVKRSDEDYPEVEEDEGDLEARGKRPDGASSSGPPPGFGGRHGNRPGSSSSGGPRGVDSRGMPDGGRPHGQSGPPPGFGQGRPGGGPPSSESGPRFGGGHGGPPGSSSSGPGGVEARGMPDGGRPHGQSGPPPGFGQGRPGGGPPSFESGPPPGFGQGRPGGGPPSSESGPRFGGGHGGPPGSSSSGPGGVEARGMPDGGRPHGQSGPPPGFGQGRPGGGPPSFESGPPPGFGQGRPGGGPPSSESGPRFGGGHGGPPSSSSSGPGKFTARSPGGDPSMWQNGWDRVNRFFGRPGGPTVPGGPPGGPPSTPGPDMSQDSLQTRDHTIDLEYDEPREESEPMLYTEDEAELSARDMPEYGSMDELASDSDSPENPPFTDNLEENEEGEVEARSPGGFEGWDPRPDRLEPLFPKPVAPWKPNNRPVGPNDGQGKMEARMDIPTPWLDDILQDVRNNDDKPNRKPGTLLGPVTPKPINYPKGGPAKPQARSEEQPAEDWDGPRIYLGVSPDSPKVRARSADPTQDEDTDDWFTNGLPSWAKTVEVRGVTHEKEGWPWNSGPLEINVPVDASGADKDADDEKKERRWAQLIPIAVCGVAKILFDAC